MDPALAGAFIGQPVNMFEQQKPDHESGLDSGPALVAVERRDLVIEPFPVELAGELHQFVPHVDDLIEPRPEQIAFTRRHMLLRPHRSLRCSTESRIAPKGNRRNENRRLQSP